ncbi:alpha-amylase family glycosyl hydrolase [Ruminococcus sp. OA3]|uniref:alpha-amylase family glycosyl hydrolase n=1 Tax=Ruminococcus sp. OA3 TaxID=2914164 RepID=UPI001F05797D|nr:alpha-amylase family glycosyl hydrolase [Ruminococcus sp. OA3]MCH1981642.1 alpha-amylase family glycosyl hydrolase [Ruminococcus sp. OA3]
MGKWYEEAVFYHMYPIGMTGAPRENTQEGVEHRFRQLHPWLDHVDNLGCTAIYIGPLFESTSHGYDTKDYKLVDRRLGDNEDFKAFVEDAHSRGIKVVVDGVFNHTGREFFAFQDIRKNRESSPYCSWYKGIWFGGDNPYHDGFSYEAWRNCFELVNLNLQEEAVREYLLEVIRYWITEFDIDGIRLDCADCLDFYFMEEMRRRTSQWKDDFWLMGEVIHGDYSRYIGDGTNMLHSVTNYELHKGLYSGHNDHNYFEIAHTIRREFDSSGGVYRGLKLYSFVDNHDVDRIASKLNVFSHCFVVYTLLYMLPGIPSIYYGSEWGIDGRKEGPNDDYLRPAVNLQEVLDDNPHPDLMEWIIKLGEVRSTHPVSIYGEYREIFLTNRQYAFARTSEEEAVVIAVNNDEVPAEIQVPVPLPEKTYINAVSGEICPVEEGRLAVQLEESGSVILYTSAKEGE